MDQKISVIVPVYNVEPYLERCLDSIVNNTYKNLEIICVDDGSTDGCGAILDRYAQADERFVVIHKANGGVSSARNCGLDVATGEYIAFVDSDDWVHPQYFEVLLFFLEDERYDFSMCRYTHKAEPIGTDLLDAKKLVLREMNLADIFSNHYTRSYVWGKLYRKELVQEHRFIQKVRIAEDAAFNGIVFAERENMMAACIEVPLYYYYSREGSLSHCLRGYNAFILARIFEEYAGDTQSVTAKRLYLIDALKRGLIGRYLMSLRAEEKQYIPECNQMLRRALKESWSMNNFSVKEKILYAGMVFCPQAYRLFRIVDDPTLLDMEKHIKISERE